MRLPAGSIIASLLLSALAACMAAPQQRDVERQVLAWIETGRTTRADVLLSLGMPRSTFEQDSIFVYGVQCQSTTRCNAVPYRADWRTVAYQLILEFNEAGVLERHRLLRERGFPQVLMPVALPEQ